MKTLSLKSNDLYIMNRIATYILIFLSTVFLLVTDFNFSGYDHGKLRDYS